MPQFRLVDTHAHLDFPAFDADRPAVLAQLAQQGIAVINIATDHQSVARVDELSRANELVWGAVGLHPTEVNPVVLTELAGMMKEWQRVIEANPKIVAIGEVGLDYFHSRDSDTASLQKAALRQMLTFAAEQNLPVIFHCREAYGDLATMLADYPSIRGVVHCFSGSQAQADAFLGLGLLLSATAIVTYPKNAELAEVFKALPADRLMVETDSPFLPSADNRGGRNDPTTVEQIVEFLAELRGESVGGLVKFTTQNAVNLFGLK